jgi:hypothetical protein
LVKTIHVSPKEMAARLGMSVAGLGNRRRRGAGPPWIKCGREVLYPVPDVSELEAAVAMARDRLQHAQDDLREAERQVVRLRAEADAAADGLMQSLVALDETRRAQ